MSVADLQLNMNIAFPDCCNQADLGMLFAKRAKVVRDGITGSPRGLKTPYIAPYIGFYIIHMYSGYELVFEHTNKAGGLPENLCASRQFGVSLYGPVFLARRVVDTFVPLNETDMNGPDASALAAIAPTYVRRFISDTQGPEASVSFYPAATVPTQIECQ